MRNKLVTLIGVTLISVCGRSYSQDCWPAYIVSTTPIESFVLKDAIALDASTGLEWARCSIGQTFVDGSCVGLATEFPEWKDALAEIDRLNDEEYLGFTDWRLPNIHELSTLVERQCFDPAINLVAFPDTARNALFSSTPNSMGSSREGRYIYFADGAEFAPDVSLILNIKIVRDPISRF